LGVVTVASPWCLGDTFGGKNLKKLKKREGEEFFYKGIFIVKPAGGCGRQVELILIPASPLKDAGVFIIIVNKKHVSYFNF
jgi:hypothetical protein